MKKAFLVLIVLVGLVVAADLVVVKFWPDTKAGEYAVIGRDTAVEWYGVTKDFWVEQWHRFRPEEAEPQVEGARTGELVLWQEADGEVARGEDRHGLCVQLCR